MVIHAREEDKRVMICKDYYWFGGGTEVYLKVLECKQQRESCIFNNRITQKTDLMFTKLT